MQIGALWQEMYRSQYFEGGRSLTAAISALDIALHDIKGKALGVPVYELLGGKQRDRIPTFVSCVLDNGEQALEKVQHLLQQGWNVIRFGHPEPDVAEPNIFEPRETLAYAATWLTKAREKFGTEFVLGIDMHHRLSVAETASFCQRMPRGTLDFLEEPIRDECPAAYQTLRSMTDVPLAIGEEFASKWQFLPYIEQGLTNYARVDICNVGGFTEAKKVAGWAEAHYIDLMPHDPLGPICTAASVQLCAAIPNHSWLEVRPVYYEDKHNEEKDIFPGQPILDGTSFPVSDAPGLGIDVDEQRIRKEPFRYWEPPHLRRRDGSYTNW
jgi:galactonate dehydratase